MKDCSFLTTLLLLLATLLILAICDFLCLKHSFLLNDAFALFIISGLTNIFIKSLNRSSRLSARTSSKGLSLWNLLKEIYIYRQYLWKNCILKLTLTYSDANVPDKVSYILTGIRNGKSILQYLAQ